MKLQIPRQVHQKKKLLHCRQRADTQPARPTPVGPNKLSAHLLHPRQAVGAAEGVAGGGQQLSQVGGQPQQVALRTLACSSLNVGKQTRASMF